MQGKLPWILVSYETACWVNFRQLSIKRNLCSYNICRENFWVIYLISLLISAKVLIKNRIKCNLQRKLKAEIHFRSFSADIQMFNFAQVHLNNSPPSTGNFLFRLGVKKKSERKADQKLFVLSANEIAEWNRLKIKTNTVEQ